MSSPITGQDFDNQHLSDSLCDSFQEKLLNNAKFKELLEYFFQDDGRIGIAFARDLEDLLPPIGSMEWSPTDDSSLDPEVWVRAEGQQISQATYPKLYAKWGQTFGLPGDDTSLLFRVPDMRSRVALGSGSGYATAEQITAGTEPNIGASVGEKGGQKDVEISLDVSHIPPHKHLIGIDGAGGISGTTPNRFRIPGGNMQYDNVESNSHGLTEAEYVGMTEETTPVLVPTVMPFFSGVWRIRANHKIAGQIL